MRSVDTKRPGPARGSGMTLSRLPRPRASLPQVRGSSISSWPRRCGCCLPSTDLGPERIATAVEMILNHQDLTCRTLIPSRRRLTISGGDRRWASRIASFWKVARKAGHLPLGTFDRPLSKLPGAQRL